MKTISTLSAAFPSLCSDAEAAPEPADSGEGTRLRISGRRLYILSLSGR